MENSLSSLAYEGSTSSAIAEAKNQRKLFIVYISGDEAESSRLESSTWTDSKVAESVSKYCILLHLTQGSNDATQFSAIFPQKSVPCITAVGYNGIQLWQNEGFIAAEVLASTLEKLWLSLHLQDTTAAVLSAALASKTAEEPSTSVVSANVSSNEGSSNVSVHSPSTVKHGKQSSATTGDSSDKAKVERTDRGIVEDKASKFGDTSSKSDEAGDVKFSASETSDSSAEAVKEFQQPPKVGIDNAATDLASRPVEGSHSPENACDSALDGLDGGSKSQSTEVNSASQDLNHEAVVRKKDVALTDVYLNIRMPNGVKLQEKFSVTSTLRIVKDYVDDHQESVIGPYDLAIPYPRKVFNDQDLDSTLSELGLLDRQALIVVPRQRAISQSNPISVIDSSSTNESNEGYFSYVKQLCSFINPLSYLGGSSSSTSSGQQSQHDTWESGSNSMPQNRFAQAQRSSSMAGQSDSAGRGSSSSTTRPTMSRYGSNIHTLKHDEDDSPSKDNNSYWNGNSTQYGGNDNGK